jgi:hypothetical protein
MAPRTESEEKNPNSQCSLQIKGSEMQSNDGGKYLYDLKT